MSAFHSTKAPRIAAAAVAVVAAAAVLLVLLAGCGGGKDGGTSTGDGSGGGPISASPFPTAPATPWTAGLVLSADQARAVKDHIDRGDEPWASAWQAFLDQHVTPSLQAQPAPLAEPYRGGGSVHQAFLRLDTDSRDARDLAIAFAVSGDTAYARKAHDILVAWAQQSRPTSLGDYDSPDTGQLQSWGAFSFAYAYDLTRASGLYTPDEARAVAAYFGRFIAALRGAMSLLASDPSVGSAERRPYEWSSALTYRFEDRVIGGDFSLALQCAVLAMAHEIGDTATVAWALDGGGNPLRTTAAIASSLTPDNDGDGQGAAPAPNVEVMKANNQGRGGTVDYMTYNARLATLLCQVADAAGQPLTKHFSSELSATWLYLARFFAPGAAPSPNPSDVVNTAIDLPRFAPAYFAVRDARLLAVLQAGSRADYYEPQFLGPVTLTHTPEG